MTRKIIVKYDAPYSKTADFWLVSHWERFNTMEEAKKWVSEAKKRIRGFKLRYIEPDITWDKNAPIMLASPKQDGSSDACILRLDY